MGQKEVVPVQVPQRPVKQMVKDYVKQIERARREFKRQTYKFEMNDRKYKAQLQKKIKNGDSMNSKRAIAQNILRNQRYTQKYSNLDAQLQGMIFQLNTMAATATMTEVMTKMTGIMKQTNSAYNVKDIQMAMMKFQTENERANVLNEMIQGALEGNDQEIQDQEADKLIRDMESKGSGNGVGIRNLNKVEEYPELDQMMQRLDKI